SNAGGQNAPDDESAPSPSLGGLKVRELTSDEKAKAKLNDGVLITDVEDGSAADRAGLEPGDVIEEVNRTVVASPEAFAKLLKDAKNGKRPAVLLVHGQQGTQFVALKLNEE